MPPSWPVRVPELAIYTVSELVGALRELVERGVGRVWVVGEVSGPRRAASGHTYFALRDEGAQLRAVLFRSDAARVPFELEDGLEVLAGGEVTVWEGRGALQMIVRELEPRGRGALQLAFEQLRRKLEREGLFAPERKRPLPTLPTRIGVVTSAHGAAIRDVIQVTRRRFPAARLLLAPTRVQGEGAATEIAEALDRIAASGAVDVVLLVRGGGAPEDLMAFNSEEVARAVARSPVPVVSGVGHEIDLTIADLVADVRAATPSAAAELVTPDRAELLERVRGLAERLARCLRSRLAAGRAGLDRSQRALARASPRARLGRWRERLARERQRLRAVERRLVEARRERLAERARALGRAAPRARLESARQRTESLRRTLERLLASRLREGRARLARSVGRLESLSPLAVLARGYAIVRRERDGAVVRGPRQVKAGEALRIRLAAGELRARVASDPDRGAG